MSKIRTFIRLPLSTKWLFLEALFTSAWVKLSLSFFPFKKVLIWLGGMQTESDTIANAQTLDTRQQIKTALVLCNKYALWPTECYTLSLTGKLLLKRRKITSTLYIGFRKDEKGKYKGHAWLRANDTYISGFKEARDFQVHSMFS
jgi:hypothetical protein